MRDLCGKVVYQDVRNPNIRSTCVKDPGHDDDCRDIFGNTMSPEGVYVKWSDRQRVQP